MRRILETSIEMDRLARDAYTLMAVRCADTIRGISVGGPDSVHVTVSIGSVVARDKPGAEQRTLEELLAVADQALSSAKEMGRDRAAEPVVLAKE